MEDVNPSVHRSTGVASNDEETGDGDEPPVNPWSIPHLIYDEDEETTEPLRSPVEVMTSYAHNSMRRLRAAIIGRVRTWTRERQGNKTPTRPHSQPQQTFMKSSTIRLRQELDRLPTDQECHDFAEFLRQSIATRSSRVKEIELVEVIRGTPFQVQEDIEVEAEEEERIEGIEEEITEEQQLQRYRVEWIFQVTEEVPCREGGGSPDQCEGHQGDQRGEL